MLSTDDGEGYNVGNMGEQIIGNEKVLEKMEKGVYGWEKNDLFDPDKPEFKKIMEEVLIKLKTDWGVNGFSNKDELIWLLFPPGQMWDQEVYFHDASKPPMTYEEIQKLFPNSSILIAREEARQLESADASLQRVINPDDFYKSKQGEQGWVYYSELLPGAARVVRDYGAGDRDW